MSNGKIPADVPFAVVEGTKQASEQAVRRQRAFVRQIVLAGAGTAAGAAIYMLLTKKGVKK